MNAISKNNRSGIMCHKFVWNNELLTTIAFGLFAAINEATKIKLNFYDSKSLANQPGQHLNDGKTFNSKIVGSFTVFPPQHWRNTLIALSLNFLSFFI